MLRRSGFYVLNGLETASILKKQSLARYIAVGDLGRAAAGDGLVQRRSQAQDGRRGLVHADGDGDRALELAGEVGEAAGGVGTGVDGLRRSLL